MQEMFCNYLHFCRVVGRQLLESCNILESNLKLMKLFPYIYLLSHTVCPIDNSNIIMATSITTIPLACLPIQTIAQLATTNMYFAEQAYKEYLLRDIGTELYCYLQSRDPTTRMMYIEKLSNTQMWKVIDATRAFKTPPESYWSVMILPPFSPVRININSLAVDSTGEIIFRTHSVMDILRISPLLIKGRDIISYTVDDAIKTLHFAINRHVWNLAVPIFIENVRDDFVLDWVTSSFSFYMVNARERHIYTMPSCTFSHLMIDNQYRSVNEITMSNEVLPYIISMLVDAELMS